MATLLEIIKYNFNISLLTLKMQSFFYKSVVNIFKMVIIRTELLTNFTVFDEISMK